MFACQQRRRLGLYWFIQTSCGFRSSTMLVLLVSIEFASSKILCDMLKHWKYSRAEWKFCLSSRFDRTVFIVSNIFWTASVFIPTTSMSASFSRVSCSLFSESVSCCPLNSVAIPGLVTNVRSETGLGKLNLQFIAPYFFFAFFLSQVLAFYSLCFCTSINSNSSGSDSIWHVTYVSQNCATFASESLSTFGASSTQNNACIWGEPGIWNSTR